MKLEGDCGGVWACGEVERACRVCGAEGGGRPWRWGVGERRWRVEGLAGLTRFSVVARSTECERGAGGLHGVGVSGCGGCVGVW